MPRLKFVLQKLTLVIALAGLPAMGGYGQLQAQTQIQNQTQAGPQDRPEGTTFAVTEIVDAGHQFFGQTSVGLASIIEYVFAQRGEPAGYIVGQEASGAIIGGLRYGEGELRMKTGERLNVFWQGPTLGFDFGADGSRTMVLVYGLSYPDQIYDTFTSAEGTAFIAGGLGVNFQSNAQGVTLAVIRTGIGLRLGVNLGYLKYTPEATWNPF
ncbi:FIG00450386: membrane protein [hydrothermal vent metagenome]|uniref:FIG00450386: membrane protein n=1 Tax=hydrothermal vent metagenome TaxID=652676 RepID=A0A3B0TNI3_9ZZZZ